MQTSCTDLLKIRLVLNIIEMKKLLLGLMLAVCASCTSPQNETKNFPPEFDPVSYYMNKYDLSASDTIDLRMFGLYAMPDTNVLVLLGNKKGHLWIKFVESMPYDKDGVSDIICKEIKQLEIQSQFNDIRKVELGYGESVIDTIKYLELDEYDMLLGLYSIFFHDYEHFAISKSVTGGTISWVICNDKIIDIQGWLKPLLNGYYDADDYYNNKDIHIYNEYGDLLYMTEYLNIDGLKFINMYEYIKCDYDSYYENNRYEYKWRIRKMNAETNETAWTYIVGNIGTEINGNQPKIDYKIETSENYITCTFDCTNYDGTKEQKIIKLNMDGESID